jgi:hypothetical protein
MFGLTDVVISNSAQQTVNTYAEKAANVVTSDALCFKTEVTVPPHIAYFGGIKPPKRFYYLMHVSRYPEQFDPEQLTSIIFAVSDRKDPSKLRAASRIDVNAQVIFYDWNPTEINVIDEEAAAITLDPQSAIMRKDSLIIIKEVLAGKSYLHIVACSSDGMCEANLEEVGCMIMDARGTESSCLPCSG